MTTTLVSEAGRKIAPGTHELAVLDQSTREATRVTWNPTDVAETAKAKEIFDRAMAAGSLAYDVSEGAESEVVKNFDPETQHIVMSSPLVGG